VSGSFSTFAQPLLAAPLGAQDLLEPFGPNGPGSLPRPNAPAHRCQKFARVSDKYRIARLMGDINAVKRGRVGRRIGRRAAGKVTGRAFRKLFG
jgi:hypothetical protein